MAPLEFLGRLHPIVLHVPLTLLVLGGLVEGARRVRDTPFRKATSHWLFGWGAAFAVVAAATGWLLAANESVRSDQRGTLEWHRWLGVAAVVGAILVWLTNRWETRSPRLYRLRLPLAVFTAGAVIATGHFGGALIWGHDWF
ncbi:DUF2231 domain-containing protein [Opitutus terrae]|uniref:DUF2231 domain-containing protein n=1 Tax=Opitutus terrae (strain DSM 11246 / JCM 15787 / PB90-1) TaxID=452637 RepID=B1ZPY8_OPITP|nr:DUF2231 domain-containing protein [Opitutus terrae]ACB77709.1 hypothetical protein Oter_4438 [Opitutus terrae PB90-1]